MEVRPIIWNAGGEGAGVLSLGRPKVDAGDSSRRTWDVTITSAVESAALAGQLDLFYGDVAKHWTEAMAETHRYRGSVQPLVDQFIYADFSTEGEDAVQLVRVRVEIREVKVDFNTGRKVQISRLRLHGVNLAYSAHLLAMQEQQVLVQVDVDAPPKEAAQAEVGQVAAGVTTAGATVVGRVVEIDGETDQVVVDDFGSRWLLSSVTSAMFPESPSGNVEELCERYVAASDDPSWGHLVEASARVGLAGGVQQMTSSTVYLNDAVVDEALGLALPVEA